MTAADRHHQQRGGGVGGTLKAANGGMLPFASSATAATRSLKKGAADGTSVAATPRSIGGARVAHFAATHLGQRTAGDASSVRRNDERQQQLKSDTSAAVRQFFSSSFAIACVSSRVVLSNSFRLVSNILKERERGGRRVPIACEKRRIACGDKRESCRTTGGERNSSSSDNGYIGGGKIIGRGGELNLFFSFSHSSTIPNEKTDPGLGEVPRPRHESRTSLRREKKQRRRERSAGARSLPPPRRRQKRLLFVVVVLFDF